MTSFGEKLKAAREDRGIALSDVSAATNVGLHLLEALEANEFERLPGGPFNKGFVRAYARHIGIDPEEAVGAYAREERSQGIRTLDVEREMPRAEHRLLEFRDDGDQTTLVLDWTLVKRILMATGALILIVAATWLLWPSGESAQGGEPGSAAMTPPLPAAAAAVDPPDPGKEDILENDAPAPAQREIQTPITPPPPASVRALEPAGSPLDVVESGVGTGVRNRQLTGRGDRFPVGTQVWFWTRTLGGSPGDLLHHVWLREGIPILTYERTLGGPHWRNSSRKTLGPGSEGSWIVEARDAQGRVVARTAFDCIAE